MVPKYSVSSSSVSYFRLEELFDRAILNYETFILWVFILSLIFNFLPFLNYSLKNLSSHYSLFSLFSVRRIMLTSPFCPLCRGCYL